LSDAPFLMEFFNLNKMKEIWKDAVGYEGLYQVSSLGRVYSCPREWVVGKSKALVSHNGRMLKFSINKRYPQVVLCKDGKLKTKLIHHLVAESFLNHFMTKGLNVDHINNISTDNRLENLQVISHRQNNSKDKVGTSKFTGVCWLKKTNNWKSAIRINGKERHLGTFKCETSAHLAYQKKLQEIEQTV
jgi:hypothetical protein